LPSSTPGNPSRRTPADTAVSQRRRPELPIAACRSAPGERRWPR
jgi:hypothetical protein